MATLGTSKLIIWVLHHDEVICKIDIPLSVALHVRLRYHIHLSLNKRHLLLRLNRLYILAFDRLHHIDILQILPRVVPYHDLRIVCMTHLLRLLLLRLVVAPILVYAFPPSTWNMPQVGTPWKRQIDLLSIKLRIVIFDPISLRHHTRIITLRLSWIQFQVKLIIICPPMVRHMLLVWRSSHILSLSHIRNSIVFLLARIGTFVTWRALVNHHLLWIGLIIVNVGVVVTGTCG